MNLSSLAGLIIAGMVLQAGVFHSAPNPALFLDSHAMILVLGGTLAAALIAYPAGRLLNLIRFFFQGMLFKRLTSPRALAHEIITASFTAQHDKRMLLTRKAMHPFLEEGYRLVGENLLSGPALEEVLKKRSQFFRTNYLLDAKILTSIAKFPPAFGLLGASTGMITMMTNLGKGGQDAIGPAMAVALVATFWGIALANLVFLPLADHATKIANDDYNVRKIIAEGVMMLYRGESPFEIAEKLNCHLPVKQRLVVQYAGNNKSEASQSGLRKSA